VVGAVAIQNRATLGGNLANASPAADSSPALLVYDAKLELVSMEGIRWVEYEKFHLEYKQLDLKSDELIRTIRLPRMAHLTNRKEVHHYRKVGTRKAQAISKVSFAGIWTADDSVTPFRVALGGVAPTVLRCRKTEKLMAHLGTPTEQDLESVKHQLSLEISPIDDIRSTREYRTEICFNLLGNFLEYVGLDRRT
jgi:CO/xanthine dehydrogenase FAD-binding subunit